MINITYQNWKIARQHWEKNRRLFIIFFRKMIIPIRFLKIFEKKKNEIIRNILQILKTSFFFHFLPFEKKRFVSNEMDLKILIKFLFCSITSWFIIIFRGRCKIQNFEELNFF